MKTIYNKFYTFYLGSLLVILLNSCGSSPEHIKYIPQESSLVFTFNLNSIITKTSNWKELASRGFLQNFKINLPENQEDLSDAIINSGIDFKNNAFLFADFALEDNKNNYSAVTFKLSDVGLFAEFIKNIPNLKSEVKTEKDIQYTIISENQILSWSGKTALLLNSQGKLGEEKLKQLVFYIFELPKESSLYEQNKEFKNLQSEKFDIATWVNVTKYEKTGERFISSLTPFSTPIKLKDNYLTASTNFEKGEILTSTKYSMNESFTQFKGFFKNEVNSALISSFPIKNPLAMFAMGFSPKGLQEALKGNGLVGLIATFIKKPTNDLTGVPLDELVSYFTGDVAWLLKNIEEVDVTNNTIDQETGEPLVETSYKMDYQFILGLQLKESAKIRQILLKMSEMEQKGGLMKKDDYYVYEPAPGSSYYFILKEDILYITSSEGMRGELFKKNATKTEEKFAKMGEKSAFVGYLDVQKDIRKKLPSLLFNNDKATEQLIRNLDTPFEYITINTPVVSGDYIESKIVVYLNDKDRNALETIVDFLKNAGKGKKRNS